MKNVRYGGSTALHSQQKQYLEVTVAQMMNSLLPNSDLSWGKQEKPLDHSVSSVTQSCLTLCHPMDCSTPGFPVHHQLLELTHTHVHWVGDALQPSHPAIPFSSCLQSFPASGSFRMSLLIESDGQTTGASASASVLPMSIQGWFPLGLTGLISLMSKGLSRVFSSSTVQSHQFFHMDYMLI